MALSQCDFTKYIVPLFNKNNTMSKIIIIPALLLVVMAACNNTGNKEKKDTDTTATDHSQMDHSTPGADVPALPAVPEGAKVFFANLKDGDVVSSPLAIEMGASSIKVDTAGPIIAGVGHHHLLVDAGDSVVTGTVIPMDSAHIHFGKAQTKTEVKLTPGKHRLTLQFADGLHRSYGAGMANSITVEVKK